MSLRILHIAPYSPDAWAYGGIPRVVAGMTLGLAERGHRVTLCTTDASDSSIRLAAPSATSRWSVHPPRTIDGVEWRVFPNVSNRAAYGLQAFAPFGLRSYLAAHATSFDVAHVHACHNIPGALAVRVLAGANVPWVASPNGTAPMFERRIGLKRLLHGLGGSRVLAEASRVAAVSKAEEQQLLALGIDSARIRRLANPLDMREFAEGLGSGRFRRSLGIGSAPMVAFVGKVTPRKQVATIVEAFARLTADAHLVLAGNDLGGLRPALRRAATLGIQGRTHTTGLLRGVDRLHLMADADVVVYPSHGEVFGLVPCEALLAGTPVVVGSDSGCAEIISDAGGGLTVPPGDAASLAAAIGLVLGAPLRWRHDARKAGERVRSLYGHRVVASHLETLYAEVLAPRRAVLSA